MTEKEEKASDKILRELAELKSELQKMKMSNNHSPPPQIKGHETIEEMLECPNCYPKVRDGVVKKEGFIKPIGKRDRHEYEKICKGCGLRGKKEDEKCPSCGSTDYY